MVNIPALVVWHGDCSLNDHESKSKFVVGPGLRSAFSRARVRVVRSRVGGRLASATVWAELHSRHLFRPS